MFKKIGNGFLIIFGYLLSPLCWWNDLIINLPIAYLFGKICTIFFPNIFLVASLVGYWLSNIVGVLLMQFGTIKLLQKQPENYNLKKDLLIGLLTSTAYTIAIVALIHFKILDTPLLSSLMNSETLQ
jgi:hypothetical protein